MGPSISLFYSLYFEVTKPRPDGENRHCHHFSDGYCIPKDVHSQPPFFLVMLAALVDVPEWEVWVYIFCSWPSQIPPKIRTILYVWLLHIKNLYEWHFWTLPFIITCCLEPHRPVMVISKGLFTLHSNSLEGD